METLLTIGICVRNGQLTIGNAIESILNQSFPHDRMQVIFVDDGSDDHTPDIISRYLPLFSCPTRFLRTTWKGLGQARNLVVQNTQGQYLLFVDADEILTSEYVKSQVEVLEKNPKIGITSGVFRTVPGNLILNLEIIPYIVNQRNYLKPRSFIWKTDKLIGAGGTAFRVEALKQVNGFDESIKGAGEDTDLVLRIKKAGWLIRPNMAELYEFHGGLSKPKDLWKKYYWYGYGCQRTVRQTRGAFSIPRMTPIAGLVAGVFYSLEAYKLMYKKIVFLLPFHFSWKLAAWTCGYMRGQIQDSMDKT